MKGSPHEWATRAVNLYHRYAADRVIAEVNNGGLLVENTLRTADQNVPFRSVHACRAKLLRAEPISALYEQGRVHHVGHFAALEDEMTSYDGSGNSPDRLDALVHGLTDLMVAAQARNLLQESRLGQFLGAIPFPLGGINDFR
jgi:phage terminase large subunit-like protein